MPTTPLIFQRHQNSGLKIGAVVAGKTDKSR